MPQFCVNVYNDMFYIWNLSFFVCQPSSTTISLSLSLSLFPLLISVGSYFEKKRKLFLEKVYRSIETLYLSSFSPCLYTLTLLVLLHGFSHSVVPLV